MIRFECQNSKLILRSPVLPITQKLFLGTKIKRSMNGILYAYKGAAIIEVDWNFKLISREKTIETIYFLRQFYSQQTTVYIYHEIKLNGRVIQEIDEELWKGKIINKFEKVQPSIHNNTFNIQFEGFQYPLPE